MQKISLGVDNEFEAFEDGIGLYPFTSYRTRTIKNSVIPNTRHCTVYGYAFEESFVGTKSIEPGQFFSMYCFCDELFYVGNLFLVVKPGFRGQNIVGDVESGPGRLSYIDGCSDSLLVYPPRCGDPSLNYLYFPEKTTQSKHSHPSVRVGVVISGSGNAIIGGEYFEGETHKINQGDMFILHEKEIHLFETSSESMEIVVFHPDGDWGPTDEVHTMLNRTHLIK